MYCHSACREKDITVGGQCSVAQSLVFCVVFYRPLFVLLAIVLSVLLRIMASDYPFGIFKLFSTSSLLSADIEFGGCKFCEAYVILTNNSIYWTILHKDTRTWMYTQVH